MHRAPPRPPRLPRLRAQRGFSLAELMIAAAIGLVILAGMTTLFVNNTRAQTEIEKANRQVENGRFGIQMLAADLRNAGYYAEFDLAGMPAMGAVPDPCAVTLAAITDALPAPVQGIDNATAGELSCAPGLRAGTDVLVVRRTATCVVGQPGCSTLADGGPFFQASLCPNQSELGSGLVTNHYRLDLTTATLNRRKNDCGPVAGSGTPADVRRYLTHIYYIADNDRPGDGVPTLKRVELGMSGGQLRTTVVPLVNGIENLQLEYGVDTVRDGSADVFTPVPLMAAGCTEAGCPQTNWTKVVSVKLSLLARNVEPTAGFTDNKRYQLGLDADGEPNVVGPTGDAFKRHVFQSMVVLPNPAGRRTP